MGAREQRLQLAQGQLENTKVYLDQLVSKAEDIDMTEVISKMNLAQVALQAGLQSGARVMQTSLLDFIR
jgi:flagellar hook-associated protein 3 FlgL